MFINTMPSHYDDEKPMEEKPKRSTGKMFRMRKGMSVAKAHNDIKKGSK